MLAAMGASHDYAEMERVCATLESIAEKYPASSAESLAIRDASLAYVVVFQHEVLRKSYDTLRLAFDGQLSDEMKTNLRRHGIDADALENDPAGPLHGP